METKRVVVVVHEPKRKFVQVDFESLTNTMDAVRRKWNLLERFILQGKIGEDLVDIDDDDDLAAFKDADQLFMCLAQSDEAAGAHAILSESPEVSTISIGLPNTYRYAGRLSCWYLVRIRT
jgi:hypothetical protein